MALLRHHHTIKTKHPKIGFWSIYPLSLLFVFHMVLVAYINSSYMEQYLSAEGVGSLYIIGSALAVIFFLFFSHALNAVGNVKLTIILGIIDFGSLLVMGMTDNAATAIVAFTTFLVVNPLMYLNIDIFSEAIIGSQENTTGGRRGLTLTLMGLAATIAPFLMGYLLGDSNNYQVVYYAAAGVFLVFIIFLIFRFQTFEDPEYDLFNVRTSLRSMWVKKDLRNVMVAHFLLQIFFAWTVIYFPLYMHVELGFAWDQLSYILGVALLAYVIVEWPAGVIADKWLGEKELMALGFLIMAISISWVSFMTTMSILPWMVLLFMTRVGAALAESTTEVYFFKHTDGGDADTIGFFRLLRPLATVFGAIAGSVTLLYLPFNLIFVVLGLIMVPGILVTLNLKDTK